MDRTITSRTTVERFARAAIAGYDEASIQFDELDDHVSPWSLRRDAADALISEELSGDEREALIGVACAAAQIRWDELAASVVVRTHCGDDLRPGARRLCGSCANAWSASGGPEPEGCGAHLETYERH